VAGATLLRRLSWQAATVTAVADETPRVRTLALDAGDWPGHRAGQHVDIRLTAEDGYRAERAYSIASAPGEPLTITVELLEDGEVSPYLVEVVREGDAFDVRGPIGGYFVWDPVDGGPLLLVAGGSGVVPMRAMLRHRRRSDSDVPTRLLYSARTLEDVIYRDELAEPNPVLRKKRDPLAGIPLRENPGLEVILTLTRARPPGWTGRSGRVDAEVLREVAWPASDAPLAFVCGPTSFVEAVASGLVELGYDPARVKTERFGATGR
jgi:ferredoxin-NADP reductase